MKKKLGIIFSLQILLTTIAYGQTDSETALKIARDSLLKRENDKTIYNCRSDETYSAKMTLDESLDNFIFKTFDRVVIGNDELIKNGTALNLSVSDKTKLGGNYLTKISNSVAFSFGLNTAVSNNEAAIINNKGKLQSGWGVSSKISLLPGKNWAKFDPEKCDSFSFARKEFITSQLKNYSSVVSLNIDTLNAKIKSDSIQLSKQLSDINSLSFDPPMIDYKKATEKLDSLKKIRTAYYKLIKLSGKDLITEVLDKDIKNFENKNAPWNGYTIIWVDLELSANSTGKTLLYTSTLVNATKISENEIFWKHKIGPSFNYARVGRLNSFYFNLLLSLQNAYILEGKQPLDTFNLGNIAVVNKEKNSSVYDISQLPNYKDQQWVFSPSFLINSFHCEKKVFGWELFFETLFRNDLKGIDNDKKIVMNARIGLMANFSEKFKTSLPTIGVFLKADEYNFKGKMNDYLSIGLRVGVPFDKIFNKKS